MLLTVVDTNPCNKLISSKMLFGDETSLVCDAIPPYFGSFTEIGWIDLKHHSRIKYMHFCMERVGVYGKTTGWIHFNFNF